MVAPVDAGDLGFVLFFLGCVVALPTAVLVYILATDDGALARFNATKRESIQSAQPKEGVPLRIDGIARASEKLVGPFTGREVAFYRIVVIETVRYLEGTTLRERMTRHVLEASRAPVLVKDATGEARVVVDGEENFGKLRGERIDVGGAPLPDRVQAALDARGIATKDERGDRKRLVCTELAILPGDELIVIGPARRVARQDGDGAGYRDAGSELVMGERGPGAKRFFVMTNEGERSLGAGDRSFLAWTYGLAAATVVLLGGGAWLLWG
jgi:hypothetical protein